MSGKKFASWVHLRIVILKLKYNSVEITNKMQPCNRIYYSTVHWQLSMNGGIMNSVTRLHLVRYFYWVILRCTDPWILNLKYNITQLDTPSDLLFCVTEIDVYLSYLSARSTLRPSTIIFIWSNYSYSVKVSSICVIWKAITCQGEWLPVVCYTNHTDFDI